MYIQTNTIVEKVMSSVSSHSWLTTYIHVYIDIGVEEVYVTCYVLIMRDEKQNLKFANMI